MTELQPGQVLNERYRLIRVISGGTFGAIWEAEHLALRSPVAVKVLERRLVAGEDMRQRFSREARAAAALRGPHVVQILDCGVAGDTPYIAMELLDGESLEQRLERVGVLDVSETERVVRHVARAIERASEAGVIHRDLKPGNIFIQANDGDEMIKVLDFGIAKTNVDFDRSLVGATPAGLLIGTPHYMSPEYIRGDQSLDVRADLWALAVIAYECLIGVPPFLGDTINAVLVAICSEARPVPSEHGNVPAGFDTWFLRACAAHPDDRFASAKQLAEEFGRLRSAAAASHPAAAATAPVSLLRSRFLPVALGLCVAIVAAAVWPRGAARPDVTAAALAASQDARPPADPAPAPSTPWLQVQDVSSQPAAGEAVAASDAARRLAKSSLTTRPSSELESDGSPRPPRRAKPAPRSSSRPLRRAVGECDPPWDLDSVGKPRAKPECL